MIKCNDKIAVIILNWNGRDMMRRFLPFVVKHSEGEGVVIVADNGSTDGSLEMLEAEFPNVQRLPLLKNYGFAEGYNRAIAQIDAPYYLMLNSDVETTPGWLSPLREHMDFYPRVAACQPKILNEQKRDEFEYAGASGGFLDHYGYPFCRGRIFSTIEKDLGQYDTTVTVLWATGAALMVRREAWKDVGGFDCRFFAHMEEIDFCWRLSARGYTVRCVPDSVVYHVGGATLSAEDPRKTFLNFRNNLLMLYKNAPDEHLHSIMRIRFWLDLLASLKFLASGHPRDFMAVWRARREYQRIKHQFTPQRKENLEKQVDGGFIPEWTGSSILWQYYFRRYRTFDKTYF